MSTIEKAIEKLGNVVAATPQSGDARDQKTADQLHSTIQQAIETLSKLASQPGQTTQVDTTASVEASIPGNDGVPEPDQRKTGLSSVTGLSREVTLDLLRLRAAGMITSDTARTQIAEEFRMIKRPLLKNAFGQGAVLVKDGNLIMVTSAFPSEGKTFNAINLAMSIATELDNTVLLIDADVARPSVTSYLGIESGPGLVDYLLGDYPDLSQLMIKTDIPKLTLLPAGRRHHHSTELLASENMRTLMAELSQRYPDRVVIFDSPPLLATTEASVLAGLVGQIVVVVESEKTTQDALKEALSLLDANKSINLILNKSRQSFGSDYYGSYYGTYGQ
ncbi:MAG: tyrosine-protein kinase family protein [Gammaproteobacteria bacterium]|nr:tyrosine-protein kinase family protein [Gammaproteobacteria bacterium]